MVVVIILLHALVTINFAATWSFTHSAFIDYGQNFLAVFSKLNGDTQATGLVMGIASSMSTILADLFMVLCDSAGDYAISLPPFDSRCGTAGWFGGVVGLLFCFQYFL